MDGVTWCDALTSHALIADELTMGDFPADNTSGRDNVGNIGGFGASSSGILSSGSNISDVDDSNHNSEDINDHHSDLGSFTSFGSNMSNMSGGGKRRHSMKVIYCSYSNT